MIAVLTADRHSVRPQAQHRPQRSGTHGPPPNMPQRSLQTTVGLVGWRRRALGGSLVPGYGYVHEASGGTTFGFVLFLALRLHAYRKGSSVCVSLDGLIVQCSFREGSQI